jgi:hypothetical protein
MAAQRPLALLLSGLFTLAIAAAGTAAPVRASPDPAPPFTITRYVSTPDPARYYSLGCAAGQAAQANGPGSGIAILDFGQPRTWDNGRSFGTYDFGNHLDTIATITAVTEAWLRGWWDCTRPGGPFIRLAAGTSNYQGSTTFDHGRAWGQMVNEINDWIRANGYASRMAARGASDMELSWNISASTRAWVDGYNAVARYNLYDYGDCEGGLNPPAGWTVEDVWYKAYGARLNSPVPEIYYEVDATLDWQPLSLWAYTHKGAAIQFVGTLTQYGDDPTTLTPTEGWRALHLALGRDPRTAQPNLAYATDITAAETHSGPTPPSAPHVTIAPATLGLLAADTGPVPLPGRRYTIANKWLGTVGGTFTAVYAGSDREQPGAGVLAVFQPESDQPLRIYRAPGEPGALRILASDGQTVTLSGNLSFDLGDRSFH